MGTPGWRGFRDSRFGIRPDFPSPESRFPNPALPSHTGADYQNDRKRTRRDAGAGNHGRNDLSSRGPKRSRKNGDRLLHPRGRVRQHRCNGLSHRVGFGTTGRNARNSARKKRDERWRQCNAHGSSGYIGSSNVLNRNREGEGCSEGDRVWDCGIAQNSQGGSGSNGGAGRNRNDGRGLGGR